jgi:rhamnogalacturonan acetylesterase
MSCTSSVFQPRGRSLLRGLAGLWLLAAGLLVSVTAPRAAAEDDRPVVNDSGVAPEKPASGSLPTLWIAGDSTVKSGSPMRGWGQDLGTFFDPKKINVVNQAIGGRSSRTFYTEGRWQKLVDGIKLGDWVIIQFGHNDVGSTGASSKFRGSVKGIGDNTETVTKDDGTTEVVQSYGWYLKTMARAARAKGANVILCSPVPHKKFDSAGKPVRDWTDYRAWVQTCAKDTGAYYIDLCELIARDYDKLKQPEIEALFADKGTHTNDAGSLLNARALVKGLKTLPKNPLGTYFSATAK